MKTASILLYVLGILLLGFAMFYDTTAGDSYSIQVNNLGLMQYQMMLLHLGIGCSILGGIFHGFSQVIERLDGTVEAEMRSEIVTRSQSDTTEQPNKALIIFAALLVFGALSWAVFASG